MNEGVVGAGNGHVLGGVASFVLAHLLACAAFVGAHLALGLMWIDLIGARIPQGYSPMIVFGVPFVFAASLLIGLPATAAVWCSGRSRGAGYRVAVASGLLYGAAVGLALDIVLLGLFEGGALGMPAFLVSCTPATAIAAAVFVAAIKCCGPARPSC